MNRIVSVVAITAALSACSHSDRGPSQASGYAGPGAPRSSANDASGMSHAPGAGAPMADEAAAPSPASPPSSAKAESRALEAERNERPGLGTSWGETRSSRVSSAPFERNESGPFAVLTLNYNDAAGVRAMTRSAALGYQDGFEVAGGALSVRLLDAAGRPLPTYAFGSRHLVVGSDGDRYVIQIRNRTNSRFEAVTTVDGLDVIDGQPGSPDKRGYLLGPWATVEIDGFRQNLEQVAAFRFGSVRDSYAGRKGQDRNVGVIGVAFFAEQNAPYPWLEREVERRREADPFPGRFASPPN